MSTHGPHAAGVAKSPNQFQRLAPALHFSWLLALTLACANSTGPKAVSFDVLPGFYAGVGTPGSFFVPSEPHPLYQSPSLKVEAVSASVMIAANLTYNFSAVYRVTRAASITTVEWNNSGEIRARTPGGAYSPNNLDLDLVQNGSSTPLLRGYYIPSVCLSGFGLSYSPGPCRNTRPSIIVNGIVPPNLIPDGPDITFTYEMYRG